jgi:hypothetical protein
MDIIFPLKTRFRKISKGIAVNRRLQSFSAHMKAACTPVVERIQPLLKLILQRIILNLERCFHRSKWLSFQYFELGSLINLYMTAIVVADRKKREAKLQTFSEEALQVFQNYKWGVSRRVKNLIKTDADSSHEIAEKVYRELQDMSRLYNRAFRWKRVAESLRTLIKEYFTR